ILLPHRATRAFRSPIRRSRRQPIDLDADLLPGLAHGALRRAVSSVKPLRLRVGNIGKLLEIRRLDGCLQGFVPYPAGRFPSIAADLLGHEMESFVRYA